MVPRRIASRHVLPRRVTSIAFLSHTHCTSGERGEGAHERLLFRVLDQLSVLQGVTSPAPFRVATRSLGDVRKVRGREVRWKGVLRGGGGGERARSACVFWAAGPNVDCTIGLYPATRNHHHHHHRRRHHHHRHRRYHRHRYYRHRRRRRRRFALPIDFSAQPPRPEHTDRRRLLDAPNTVALLL